MQLYIVSDAETMYSCMRTPASSSVSHCVNAIVVCRSA
jgi:hypothetical protein